MKFSSQLNIAIKAAKAAGKIIYQNYGKHNSLYYKTGMDFITEIDIKAEQKIISIIKKKYPNHSIFGEESGKEIIDKKYMWIIDPLDGTTNFTMGNPFFNTSIALVKNNEIILGVVYNPISDELFFAEKNKGAYLNNKKINVNNKKEINKSVIAFCHGSSKIEHIKKATKIYSKMKLKANHTRQLGSAALELAYVACGRVSCFYMNNINAYDVAAGSLIVKEANGKISDFKNNEFNIDSKDLLASNKLIHKEILKIINSI
jgi:myo-inositol-1(or 4)-monophosphatase